MVRICPAALTRARHSHICEEESVTTRRQLSPSSQGRISGRSPNQQIDIASAPLSGLHAEFPEHLPGTIQRSGGGALAQEIPPANGLGELSSCDVSLLHCWSFDRVRMTMRPGR